MNYTLNQLRIFLKVVQQRSITKASEELHLTQPAVSIQIKNFQEQFDIPLLEKIGRKIHVTNFGNEVAKSCEVILEEIERVEIRKMAYLGHVTGTLRVSVVSTGKYVMPYFFSEFMKKYPGIQLNMDVTNKAKVIQSIERNEVDFALVSILPKGFAIEQSTLMHNKLYLVAKKDKLKGKKIKSPKDLEKLTLLFRENGSATRTAMEAYLKKYKVQASQNMELTSNEAIKQAVLAGLGCSIMPLIGIGNELMRGDMEIVEMKGLPMVSDWNLIWLKSKSLSPAAEAYLKYIEEKKEAIIETHFAWYTKF
ncbi:MAG: DNA-binding transcriptional LysR family regulator [Vicingaceae bacterium]|jgi:DNA-binding transcriptional LysR family regulator